MTLASSGEINLVGSSTSPQRSIAAELNVSAPLSLRDANVLSLAGKTSGQSVTMPTDFYGKSWVNLSSIGSVYASDSAGTVIGSLNFYSTGTWDTKENGTTMDSGSWGPSSGTGFWIRFTETSNAGSGGSWSIPSGWNEVSTTRSVSASKTSIGTHEKVFTIEISTSSSGSPVIATITGIVVSVERV